MKTLSNFGNEWKVARQMGLSKFKKAKNDIAVVLNSFFSVTGFCLAIKAYINYL